MSSSEANSDETSPQAETGQEEPGVEEPVDFSMHQSEKDVYPLTEDELIGISEEGRRAGLFLALFTLTSGSAVTALLTRISANLNAGPKATLTTLSATLGAIALVFLYLFFSSWRGAEERIEDLKNTDGGPTT